MKLTEREEQIYEDGINYGMKVQKEASQIEVMNLKAKIVELKNFIDKLLPKGSETELDVQPRRGSILR